MRIVFTLLLSLFCFFPLSAAIISGQTKQIIHMNTGFNGTDLTIFGTIPHHNIKSVSLEVFGPMRQFKTLHTKSQQEETLSLPSFYAGNASDQIASLHKIVPFLKLHDLLQPSPKVTINENKLFSSHISLPADAPIGNYKIKYEILDDHQQKHIHHTEFHIQAIGLQHILYKLATEHPLLNAIIVIISATSMSHIIRFAMRKN